MIQAGSHSLLDLPLPSQCVVLWFGAFGKRPFAVRAGRHRNQHAKPATHPDAHDLVSRMCIRAIWKVQSFSG